VLKSRGYLLALSNGQEVQFNRPFSCDVELKKKTTLFAQYCAFSKKQKVETGQKHQGFLIYQ